MNIKAIRTKADHRSALKKIESLMGARRGTPEGEKLDVLVTLVEAYERKHYPLDAPHPKVRRSSPGKAAVARLRGSLKHLNRSADKLMALTRGEVSSAESSPAAARRRRTRYARGGLQG